jgi:hypothetical protein
MVLISGETRSNLPKRLKETTHFSEPNSDTRCCLRARRLQLGFFPATETMKGCGRCAKPRSGSGRFCKPLWGRSVRPQGRHRPHPSRWRSRAPAPSSNRVAARTGSELEIVANHGVCLMRQILWTMTPAAAEIPVTCIEVLPRVPEVFENMDEIRGCVGTKTLDLLDKMEGKVVAGAGFELATFGL